MKTVLCLIALSFALPAAAFAQQTPPPAFEQRYEGAFVGVNGNASSNTFSAGADVIARPGDMVLRNRLSFVRNEADGILAAKAFEYVGRVQRTLNERASTFGEYDFFRDRFAGVLRRQTGTVGLALTAVSNDRQSLHLDLGAGYTNEHRETGENVSSGSYLLGSAYKLTISPSADFTDELRMTGIFADAGNWHLEHVVAITSKIASGLSLKVSNALRFANFPPPGFKRTDSVTSIALVAKFARP